MSKIIKNPKQFAPLPLPDVEITQPHNKQNGNPVSIRIAVFMCL